MRSRHEPAAPCWCRRDTPHLLESSAGPARYLIIMTANIHQLIQAIHAMPVRTPEALAAVFEEHNSTLLPDEA